MKSLLQWAIRNTPAMNTLMVSVLVLGALSLWMMRREVFPEFDLEIILVTVPYPGATPAEVEEGICQKIEEAVRSIDGIKKETAIAREGFGYLVLELESTVPDVQKVLNDVRSEIDRIPSFPELAEDPEVKQITLRTPAIRVGVLCRDGHDGEGIDQELELRQVTEEVRDDLLQLPAVSQVNILGAREFEIDVEITEATLRKYGLTLQEVARVIRRENIEMPGGSMKTDSQEILLRGKNKHLVGSEIGRIPLVTTAEGVVLTVADLGQVRDEFADTTAISRINGRPALAVSIDRTSSEDLLAMVAEVKKYVAEKRMPAGYELVSWADRSVDVRDRMNMLARNGVQGLILVFLVLAVFLEFRLAFWVALGIPIALLGASGVLLYMGQTLNMLSMFAFLMTLGIVVDDAIVIGENIYAHRQQGKSPIRAAIDGTYEVIPSVASSVATTIIAFVPLLFVSGVMGKFIAVMPVAVIAMLLVSLAEATFILPCHLAEEHADTWLVRARRMFRRLSPLGQVVFGAPWLGFVFLLDLIVLYPIRRIRALFHWISLHSNHGMNYFVGRWYLPVLVWALRRPALVLAGSVTVLLLSLGIIQAGITPFVVFPKIDSNWIEAKIVYPDGTPSIVADRATQRLEDAINAINRKHSPEGKSLLSLTYRAVGEVASPEAAGPQARTSGSHVGVVEVELVDTASRNVKSQRILTEWREAAGEFPGAESLTFGTPNFGPAGTPIEFKLLAPADRVAELEEAVERCKTRLSEYPGVFDVADDSRPGKWELQLRIKKSAQAMGIRTADLAETVRASYYGEEVMRLQRGRHEVKLMVRYPRDQRRSLADFENIRVRTGDGAERPLTELAHVDVQRGYSEINRVDQLRSITVSADLDESRANARAIVGELQKNFMPDLLREFPGVRVRWEGQQEQTAESMQSMMIGFGVAMVAMFVLLTMEFRSYFQPLLIMLIIPFGAVGAVWGHALMGLPLTMFSMFGLVALSGVVVNDSIVLIDFINHRLESGMPLLEALVDAGRRRFRPVLLTSLTTVAGLIPLLTERSFQAQILIPMATSLCFGLILSTVLVLFLVPTLYSIYGRLTGMVIEELSDDVLKLAPPENPTLLPEPAAVSEAAHPLAG